MPKRKCLLFEGESIDVRLAANQRGSLNPWDRAKLVSAEFERACWLLKTAGGLAGDVKRYEKPVSIAFRLRLETRSGQAGRRYDVDNLAAACKPWIDALTLGRGKREGLGLIFDDSPQWVRGVSYLVDITPGEPYISIVIMPEGCLEKDGG